VTSFVLFTEGAFGAAVADRLEPRVERLRTAPLIASAGSLDEALAGADFAAAALWRRCPRELDALDAACHRGGVRWTSAILEDTHLRCGPLIEPYGGACHRCYRRRWLTHHPTPEREEALDAAYADAPARGVPGFTPSAVAMAVAAILLDRGESATGRLRRFDLLGCSVEETRVVRVHGCSRCSPPRQAGERYVRDLVAALEAR
jgi:bacteriocin biosynthesis cyclodehydratase domain-containing protein